MSQFDNIINQISSSAYATSSLSKPKKDALDELQAALGKRDKLAIAKAFINWVQSAASNDEIAKPPLDSLLKAINAVQLKKAKKDKRFDLKQEAAQWIEAEWKNAKQRFEEDLVNWIPRIPKLLERMHSKNLEHESKPPVDVPQETLGKISGWEKELSITGEQRKRLNDLKEAIKQQDHRAIARTFVAYVKAATEFRTIWLPALCGLMRGINHRGFDQANGDPEFDLIGEVTGWLDREWRQNEKRFTKGIEQLMPSMPMTLAALHAKNLEFVSKGLSDLLADLLDFIRAAKKLKLSVPASIELLNTTILSGQCSVAGLGHPTQQVIAWPLKARDFPEYMTREETVKLIKSYGKKMEVRTLTSRREEDPSIFDKGRQRYDRDVIIKKIVDGFFDHKRKKAFLGIVGKLP